MLKNYFLITIRKFAANKNYFFISIVGLSIALSASLLIAAFVLHENSFDNFHSKAHRIVQLNSRYTGKSETRLISRVPFPAKPVLMNAYPEVENVIRFYRDVQLQPLLEHAGNRFRESNLVFTDPEVLDVFDFEMIQGDRKNPFPTTNSIVVTEQSALRYFGDVNPIGKVIKYENSTDLTVTGIIKSPPANSHIQFDFLMPVEFQRLRWKIAANNFYDLEEDWNWHGAWTYVLLKEHTDVEQFRKKAAHIPDQFYPEDEKGDYLFGIEFLSDIHLNNELTGTMTASGSQQQLYIFIAVAFLLMTIAVINYTNLATAHFMKRLKETALRKTLGAKRGEIILQFATESIVVVFLSFLIAVAIAEISQPLLNSVFASHGLNELWLKPSFVISCFVFCVGLGILSSMYPAILIGRYSAFQIFKNLIQRQKTSLFSLRSILVIIQVSVSTLLIFGVLLIHDQMDYIKNKDLGYSKGNVLVIKNTSGLSEFQSFKNELTTVPGVSRVYRGYFPGTTISRFAFNVQGLDEPIPMYMRFIGHEFLETFEIPLVYGRQPAETNNPDSSRYVFINEKGVRELGLTNEQALGKQITYTGGNDNKTVFNLEIIGVIKDVNFESLYNPIHGSFFQFSNWGDIAIRLNKNYSQATVDEISAVWKKLNPDSPLEYSFLDAVIDQQYSKEEKLSEAIIYFTSLAILISCFGLLGLGSFITQQRTKEIGIRKVHGATIGEIVKIFISHFLKISITGSLIAIPIGLLFSAEWLQNFAYHVDINALMVLKCIAITLALTVVTVISKVIQVSSQNPVQALKYE